MIIIQQNEMIKLAFGLRELGIKYSVRSIYNGLQILCDGWDAVCHETSFGHDGGLIEIMGLPQCGNGVIGCLTAEEVLDMVREDMK